MKNRSGKSPELVGCKARPAHERTCEVGVIGVSEVERDVDDLAGGIIEHPLRDVEARPRDDAPAGQPLRRQPTLQRPGAPRSNLATD